MTNKNKQKGYRYEKLLVDYFTTHNFKNVKRVVLHQGYDEGDIHIDNGIVIQAKDCNRFLINKWMNDVEQQTKNADRLYPLLCIKNRQENVKEGFVVMKLKTLVRLMKYEKR